MGEWGGKWVGGGGEVGDMENIGVGVGGGGKPFFENTIFHINRET